ncbi:MAG: hypothetical protein ACYDD6_05410 [Acidimicrobiales bacterium]
MVRPLWWPEPDGTPVAGDGHGRQSDSVDDAFLLGDALLVAPVTGPGATDRVVSLPPGCWRGWWEADAASGWHDGGATVRLDAPRQRIPVLVRAGTVVPLDDGWAGPGGPCALAGDGAVPAPGAPDGPMALDHASRLAALHCWPTAEGDGRGAVVDDAGDGDGPVRRDRLTLTGAVPGATAVLRWERAGGYPPPAAVRVVLHGLIADTASADGTPVAVHSGTVECGPFSELRIDGLRPAP